MSLKLPIQGVIDHRKLHLDQQWVIVNDYIEEDGQEKHHIRALGPLGGDGGHHPDDPSPWLGRRNP
ncbi:hypothetical protein [Streptomyces sp. NRRL S-813]|uniref:hypothetical protein n=1 Tax=Streptomyces sp. NRRL S-813 TaxID=1463919 RepID=UPI0004BEA0F0|nr:hypothetical protein [Streptomyces sp. NRRL S-813]